MASRQRQGAADGKLSVAAAHYYARIYAAARAGCLAELRRAGCSEEEAEDIFAASLERIMRKFDPTGSTYAPAQMVALLKKACRQRLIDERRHRGVLKLVPLADASARFDAGAQSPPEAAEEREAVAMGREAISSLPTRDQALFFQRHQLGLAPEEILRRNPGLSPRTYRKVIQRANARVLAAFEAIGSGARCAEMREEHLHRYVTGEAGEEELAMVRAHLRHCRACCLGAGQMRDRLHDVASGLPAVIAVEYAHGGFLAASAARLLDAAGRVGEALGGATRAARERLRDLALKAATALPGPGGESAAGQLVGISGAKALSVCAAGAIASGCLAAGVVPGVGALELVGRGHPPDPARPARTRAPQPAVAVPVPDPGSSRTHAAQPSPAQGGNEMKQGKAARSSSEVRTEASTRPSPSPRQVGTEFGAEAAGTGAPAPPASAEPAGGEDTLSSGGEAGAAGGTSPPRRPGTATAAEFGF